MDERLFSYVKLCVDHLRPCFVASGVENVFIKDDGKGFRKGILVASGKFSRGLACSVMSLSQQPKEGSCFHLVRPKCLQPKKGP